MRESYINGKRALALVIILMLLSTGVVFAIDKRITASGHKVHPKVITASEAKKNKNWKKGFYKAYASGFTTSKAKHYSNAKLYLMGSPVKSSGRKWGTGKVSVSTGYYKGGCAVTPTPYGSAVFYGF